MWERFKFDDSGWKRGPKRGRCYRWRLQVTPADRAQQSRLNCAMFTKSGCTSSGYRTGWRCRLNDCTSKIKFATAGKVTIKAKGVEGACRGGRSFNFAPQITRLQLLLVND